MQLVHSDESFNPYLERLITVRGFICELIQQAKTREEREGLELIYRELECIIMQLVRIEKNIK